MVDRNSKPTGAPREDKDDELFKEQPLHGLISCDVCMKEIPQSVAHTEEGEDYVLYFCGLECYDKWSHPEAQKEEEEKP